jgi:hypothetical protein
MFLFAYRICCGKIRIWTNCLLVAGLKGLVVGSGCCE